MTSTSSIGPSSVLPLVLFVRDESLTDIRLLSVRLTVFITRYTIGVVLDCLECRQRLNPRVVTCKSVNVVGRTDQRDKSQRGS